MVGLERGVDRSRIEPAVARLGTDLGTVFDHDWNGIGEEELAFERQLAFHLVFDGREQCLSLFKIIAADDDQVVFQRGGLFDEALHPAVRSHFRHAKAPWIREGQYPGHTVCLLLVEEGKIRLDDRIREHDHHRSAQVFPGQPQGMWLSLHLVLDDILHLEIGIVLLHELRHLLLTQIGTQDKDILYIIRVRQSLEHIEQVLEGGLAGHTDERLRLAPGMRAHARAPAGHRDNNCKRIFHTPILPREFPLTFELYPICKERSCLPAATRPCTRTT